MGTNGRGVWEGPRETGLWDRHRKGSHQYLCTAEAARQAPDGWIYHGSLTSGTVRVDTYLGPSRLWTCVYCPRGKDTLLAVVSFHSWKAPPYPETDTEGLIMAKYLKKAKKDPKSKKDRKPDPFFAEKYEAMHEFLALEKWEDGSDRETGTMSVFLDQGQWKARLCDRDGGLVAFVSSEGFTGLLDALEEGLRDGSLDWRADRFARKAPKKKD